MDGSHFDRVVRQYVQGGRSRRGMLRAASLSATAVIAVLGTSRWSRDAAAAPSKQATPAASPEATDMNAIEIDGAWFCNQTFALCTTAPCAPSQIHAEIANCQCVVENAYAIGFKSCTERAQSGLSLYSNFSTVNVNSAFSTMTCPEDAPWANCLDMPCEIDPLNPALAICQCELVTKGPSLTFGGGCDTSTCAYQVWSAAPPTYLGLPQYEAGMKMVNQQIAIPATCPTATPATSPASTPVSA